MTRNSGFAEGPPTEFRFDIHDLERMCEVGVFRDIEDRVELLDGRVIELAPSSGGHGVSTGRTSRALAVAINHAGLDQHCLLVSHTTLLISPANVFDPDLMVAVGEPRGEYYIPDEILLVVEIAISSLRYDLRDKQRQYAGAGIAEYWIVDRSERRLRVFRSPGEETYTLATVASGDDRIEPLFAEGLISIRAGDLF